MTWRGCTRRRGSCRSTRELRGAAGRARPQWARTDGGEAGLHPSNLHDNPYSVGTVNFTGDTPALLGPDGPSLGGFACPFTVTTSDRWKLGQLRPGDTVRFLPVSEHEADRLRAKPVAVPVALIKAADDTATLAADRGRGGPPGGRLSARRGRRDPPRIRADASRPGVADAGRRAHGRPQWAAPAGIIDITPGVRSLHLHVDPDVLPIRVWPGSLWNSSRSCRTSTTWSCPRARCGCRSRGTTRSWTRPSPGKRRMCATTPCSTPRTSNSSAASTAWTSIEDVADIATAAEWLVLGLGDVYLGAPAAVRRSEPPAGDHQVQPGPDLDRRRHGRDRRVVHVHLRDGLTRRVPARRADRAHLGGRCATSRRSTTACHGCCGSSTASCSNGHRSGTGRDPPRTRRRARPDRHPGGEFAYADYRRLLADDATEIDASRPGRPGVRGGAARWAAAGEFDRDHTEPAPAGPGARRPRPRRDPRRGADGRERVAGQVRCRQRGKAGDTVVVLEAMKLEMPVHRTGFRDRDARARRTGRPGRARHATARDQRTVGDVDNRTGDSVNMSATQSPSNASRPRYARIGETDRPEAWIALRDEADLLAEAASVSTRPRRRGGGPAPGRASCSPRKTTSTSPALRDDRRRAPRSPTSPPATRPPSHGCARPGRSASARPTSTSSRPDSSAPAAPTARSAPPPTRA